MWRKNESDVLMTMTNYDILIFDLNTVIRQHADPRVSFDLGSWPALGLLYLIEHGDSTSQRKESVSTLNA